MPVATRSGRKIGVTLQKLHSPNTGRIDATRVAKFLAVPVARVARALDTAAATVHKTPDASSLQPRLATLKRALELISSATRDRQEALAWLNSAHPDLEEQTPLDVLLSGRADAVVTLLENAISGLPS